MRIVWSARSRADLLDMVRFVEEKNPSAALRMYQRIVTAGESLDQMPNRGRPGRLPGTRELGVVEPYVIVYRVGPDVVRIIRVWHSAQSRRE